MPSEPLPVSPRAPLVLPAKPDLRLGAALRGARTEFVVILAAMAVFGLALNGRLTALGSEALVGLARSDLTLAVVGVVDAVLLASSRRTLEATHDELRATAVDLAGAYDAAVLANGALHHAAEARDRALADIGRAATEREAFPAALAHDLKTPLTLIRGHAQLLAGTAHRPGSGSPPHGPVDPKRLVAGLGSIEAAVVQMTEPVDELLDLARHRPRPGRSPPHPRHPGRRRLGRQHGGRREDGDDPAADDGVGSGAWGASPHPGLTATPLP